MNTETTLIPASLKRVRFALFTFYFCQGICFSSWASRITTIKNTLELSDAAWGTILLMIPIGQICGMTLSGLLVSKLGSNRILPIAFPLYLLTLIAVGFSETQYALIISLIAFGFFGNFCNISVNTQGVTLETMYNKPIMASFHGGWSLAGFVGSAIGFLMINLQLSPIQHFLIVSALVLVVFLLNIKYLQPDIKIVKDPVEQAIKKKNKPEVFLYLLGLVAFCGMAAEGAMMDWSGVYFGDIVNVQENFVLLGFMAYMITMTLGRFLVDKATHRWGRQRVVQAGGILISAGLFIAVAYPHVILTTIAFMIIGLGTSSIVPTIYSIAGQKTKISTGMALTIVSSISFLGFLLGPPLVGYISEMTNLRYSYALVGICGIGITLLATQIRVFKKDDEK